MSTADFESFANRLRKMDKHTGKWARRQGLSCFRVYDADLPGFPLAVDRYGPYLHVAEYKRNHTQEDEEGYRLWRANVRQTLSEALQLPNGHIYFKERKPQKGKSQYEKLSGQQEEVIVEENGLKFWANLADYLDTGLFLDHRPTRQKVREQSAGKRVLNLFAYTGSFTVYAAAGGARATTTVDLSNTYLEWGQRNLELNGLSGPQHEFVRADCKSWLAEPAEGLYDIIILDPPTFSNSKAMFDVLDTQRDHPALINACLRRLAPGGHLYFSTNFRKFRLELEKLQAGYIKDITAATIPKDFRNPKIHYCWLIRHSEG
ncbi:class I SAM-dependent methyltransferase [Phaeodactylibacter luteus]|uniref:Methyltransferase n=1 Tax=Phaeodactylibacter luteus TaxID=1564516 RepID=A0A5C6RK23_9BACT|nr:class I SAM-dependent methyltransferase [Phaeodactylibacter luteus]TXB62786.1 methyltransferase [Phaeodactylibacter luteus]